MERHTVTDTAPLAPELDVAGWLNGPPTTLAALRGRVVLLEAFQMLCPGCVQHALPQAQRILGTVPADEVAVIGLHTVFEHHEVMGPEALAVFLDEYRYDLPVAIDRHDGAALPVTMQRYGLRGTPSSVLIDREGRLRWSAFGPVDDLVLGVELGRLLASPPAPQGPDDASTHDAPGTCAPGRGCT